MSRFCEDLSPALSMITMIRHATCEVEAIAWSVVHAHLRNLAFNRLPISKIAGLDLPKACGDSHLRSLVTEPVEPCNKFFRQSKREHGRL